MVLLANVHGSPIFLIMKESPMGTVGGYYPSLHYQPVNCYYVDIVLTFPRVFGVERTILRMRRTRGEHDRFLSQALAEFSALPRELQTGAWADPSFDI